MSPVFTVTQTIRFAHCDPAGIVYFPRFLEMVNDLVEDWFAEGLGVPFEEFHLRRRLGVPVVNTRVEFLKACRLGERIVFELAVEALGGSSLVLAIRGCANGEERLRLRHKTAIVSLETFRAVPIPQDLRARMQAFALPSAPRSEDPPTHDGAVPANAFRSQQLVRFAHCDPAGIVFYPRFFDLFSSVLEDWFAEGLDAPFGTDFMGPRNLRIPSLVIATEFLRACRLSETIAFYLWVRRLGRSSIELALAGRVGGELRLRAAWTVCVIDFATFRSRPIPDDLRERIARFAAPA